VDAPSYAPVADVAVTTQSPTPDMEMVGREESGIEQFDELSL
jgi:hypothetical protein